MNSDFSLSPRLYEGEAVTRKELASWYGTTPKTFKKMHEARGIFLPPGPVCPLDVNRIFAKLGVGKYYFKKTG